MPIGLASIPSTHITHFTIIIILPSLPSLLLSSPPLHPLGPLSPPISFHPPFPHTNGWQAQSEGSLHLCPVGGACAGQGGSEWMPFDQRCQRDLWSCMLWRGALRKQGFPFVDRWAFSVILKCVVRNVRKYDINVWMDDMEDKKVNREYTKQLMLRLLWFMFSKKIGCASSFVHLTHSLFLAVIRAKRAIAFLLKPGHLQETHSFCTS